MGKLQDVRLGALLHVHDEVASAHLAIESYLRYYSLEDLVIAGNVPEHLTAVCLRYGKAGLPTGPYMDRLIALSAAGLADAPMEQLVGVITDQLHDLIKLYQATSTDFVMPIHPDHRIDRAIPPRLLRYDYEMSPANKMGRELQAAIQHQHPDVRFRPVWGNPTYVRREVMLQVVDFLLTDKRLLKSLINIDRRFIYDDLLIGTAVQLLGYQVHDQRMTREVRRRRRWPFINGHYLRHQVRE